MSEFHVEVVSLDKIEKHENADSLSIAYVRGEYPVIFRTGEFKEGDLAVYIPIDSVVPDTEQWAFLKGHRRIKAKRLRGVFSMGMLAQLPNSSVVEGQNVQVEMGIEKYEPIVHAEKIKSSSALPDQDFMPKYTDIEGLRRWPNVLVEGEEVVLTEKIHGANGRWLYKDGQFWVGSRNYLVKDEPGCTWWRAMRESGLDEKLKEVPSLLFFGEVYGNIQDLKYGILEGFKIRIFDIFDTVTMKYMDYDVVRHTCDILQIEMVPELFRGPWSVELKSLAEGNSTLPNANNVREGFVVKPIKERWHNRLGRTILKHIGEGYLLRKE